MKAVDPLHSHRAHEMAGDSNPAHRQQ